MLGIEFSHTQHGAHRRPSTMGRRAPTPASFTNHWASGCLHARPPPSQDSLDLGNKAGEGSPGASPYLVGPPAQTLTLQKTPMVLKPAPTPGTARPAPSTRRIRKVTCTVYCSLPLYHTPLNGVNFLIIYIKINIYKYIYKLFKTVKNSYEIIKKKTHSDVQNIIFYFLLDCECLAPALCLPPTPLHPHPCPCVLYVPQMDERWR